MATFPVFELWLVLLISQANCSHFRGGILSWRPIDANPNARVLPTVHFKWRVSFRKSYGSQHYCDQSLTNSQTLKDGEGTLTCDNGCSGLSASLSYICTDFSDTEDWSTGIGQVDYLPTTEAFDALYASNAWITLVNGGNGKWILRTKVNLSRRPDNGLINTSPTTSMLPIVTLQRNCPSRLVIPVRDADGDFVRCRHAESQQDECGSICNRLDGTETLNEENCILEWTPTGSTGLYGYAIQVEDFLSRTDTNPLSSIPLQFLIDVIEGNSCDDVPEIVPPTPPVGSCIPIAPGETAREKVVAAVSDRSKSVMSISTVSPVGLYTSPLQLVQGSQLKYFIDVVWTPLSNTSTQEILCYTAEDNLGLASLQQCIFLVTASYPPKVLQVESLRNNMLKIVFDKPVKRPTAAANVSIMTVTSQSVAYSENTLSSEFNFDNTEVVLLTLPPGTCKTGSSYIVSLGKGAVVTTSFCGIPNEPQDISFTVGGSDNFICPNDTIVNATLGEVYVTVTWQPPVLPDGVTAKQVIGPPSSTATYPIGTKKEIQYVFVTSNSTTYVCKFLVIVGPDPHPCPVDIEVIALVGRGGAVAYWEEPASRNKVLSYPPFPGSFFEVGMHPICYHFITVTNETDSCTFNVIVKEETPCNDSVCGDHGSCVPINLTDFTCVCDDCYQGDECEIDFHICSQNLCLNGATCHAFEGSCEQFYCNCPPCFFGEFCELSVDACTSNECQNGARCLPYGDSCAEYTCQCSNCTYGTFCENEYPDPCTLDPCGLGKSCVQVPHTCQSYMCVADDDTLEEKCRDKNANTVENQCNSFPCKNGGSCILSDSGYICLCRGGFGGSNCDSTQGQFVNACQNNPCENGAQCLNSFTSNSSMSSSGQFTCRCLPGFWGFECNDNADTLPGGDMCEKDFNVCDNRGTCSNTYTSTGTPGFICTCPIGFIGQKCDFASTNPCSSNPCQNGATCISHNTYFSCNCPEGLRGPTCERPTGNSTAPHVENCPGLIVMNSTVPTAVHWQWPKVTDITGYPVPLIEANSAPEAVHEPGSSLTVKLIYESLAGIRATCSFVIVVSGNGQ